jgi:hypothetical protein
VSVSAPTGHCRVLSTACRSSLVECHSFADSTARPVLPRNIECFQCMTDPISHNASPHQPGHRTMKERPASDRSWMWQPRLPGGANPVWGRESPTPFRAHHFASYPPTCPIRREFTLSYCRETLPRTLQCPQLSGAHRRHAQRWGHRSSA